MQKSCVSTASENATKKKKKIGHRCIILHSYSFGKPGKDFLT